MIETQYLQPSARLEVDLAVKTQGMTLKVASGSFRVNGRDYVLKETQEITFKPSSSNVSICGSLALDPDTNEPFLLVDDVPEVGGQYDHYDWPQTGPKQLHVLFIFTIPSNTMSLDDVPVKVFLRKVQANG